ncbi:GcrA cell cycle regulator [Acetobacteraceae bacterium KSS8]|uniref:GcrA cell cycle regulator n=1 Tax=Endosaccharibacter trunci TaxID=2812733 RepID=A0ABT1W1U3_9PROT|nr:GcrA cell cycle regulator [Acetobacteraceae bacterium KSS8]
MEWTDESIARLRALWQEGLSTAEIGRRMGITKNAVVGKAHRLDLPARPSPIRKTDADAAAQPVAQPKRPAADRPRAPSPAPVVGPDLSARSPAAVAQAVHAPAEAASADLAPAAPVAAVLPAVTVRKAEPALAAPEPAPQDNIRLLRPEMPNPAVAPAPRVEPAPVAERPEPVRAASRPAEPREPRRRGLTCCWPLGEPGTKGFHFCGADPAPGKPYCAEHAALAYVKLRDRRDSVA